MAKGKRVKLNKKGRKRRTSLQTADFQFLLKNTSFDKKNIEDFYEGFMTDCPDGRMDREKMKLMFNAVMPKDGADASESAPSSGEIFIDQLFRIFDKDGDGSIDFTEFMIATDMSSSGKPEEKLRWAFKMYDKDSSGEIDVEEMVEIFCLMYSLQGFSEEDATDRAMKIFNALDKNGDGCLAEEEFIKGCLADNELLDLLNAGPGEAQQQDA